VFDPEHYLALLEQKRGAPDQAAPLQSWTLPEGFQRIRRLLEGRMDNRGKTEFNPNPAADGGVRGSDRGRCRRRAWRSFSMANDTMAAAPKMATCSKPKAKATPTS